jgi:hypothetical protein
MKHVLLEYQAALFLVLFVPIYGLLHLRQIALSTRLLYLCGAFSVAVLIGLNALNLGRAGFLWHDEPNILSIAAAYLHGQPMYHDRGAGETYSLLYGPSTYLIYVPLLKWFSRPLLAIRIAGFVINLANLAMLYLIPRKRLSAGLSLCLLPVAIAFLLSLPNHMFGVRGDQVLLLCLTAALLCAERLPAIPAAAASGALCGVALDFKVTVVPIVCLLLYLLWRRWGWRYAALAAAVTVAAGVSPFLLYGISWSHYVSWMALSRQQGFTRGLLAVNLLAAAFLLLPGVILRIGTMQVVRAKAGQSFDSTASVLFILSLCSCILTGSKNGAGPWHLWPLLPFIMLWTAEAAAGTSLDSGRDEKRFPPVRHMVSAIAMAATIITLRAGFRDLRIVHPAGERQQRNLESAAQEEIAGRIAQFPGQNIAMGYGRMADDPRSSERFELALAGENYFLDESALVESIKERLPMPPALQQRILGCEDLWLIPHAEPPFATLRGGDMPNDGTPFLFPDPIRTGFPLTHALLATGNSYDVWGCNLPLPKADN